MYLSHLEARVKCHFLWEPPPVSSVAGLNALRMLCTLCDVTWTCQPRYTDSVLSTSLSFTVECKLYSLAQCPVHQWCAAHTCWKWQVCKWKWARLLCWRRWVQETWQVGSWDGFLGWIPWWVPVHEAVTCVAHIISYHCGSCWSCM